MQKSKRIRAVMKEQEQTKGRISIKKKLAEKKAVIEQRDKAERTSPEKETEKKSQREIFLWKRQNEWESVLAKFDSTCYRG